jgi:hypothetical protein
MEFILETGALPLELCNYRLNHGFCHAKFYHLQIGDQASCGVRGRSFSAISRYGSNSAMGKWLDRWRFDHSIIPGHVHGKSEI